MMLGCYTAGDDDDPRTPLTLLHGFTQSGQSWLPIVERMPDRRFILVNAPGHRRSEQFRTDLTATGDLIADVMDHGVLVGYSMGARMALHTVLQHPSKVSALVLVSGTPGIEDDTERAQRRAADNALADHIESTPLEQFIDEWLANPMFAGLTEDQRDVRDRLMNTPAGLASSLRMAGTGTQIPLWDRLHEITCPVLIVCGEKDEKFTEIGRRMHGAILGSRLVVVPGAGHTVHLEKPDEFARLLESWLSEIEG